MAECSFHVRPPGFVTGITGVTPTRAALTFHSLAVISVSKAILLGLLLLRLAKNWPVTPSMFGEEARKMDVRAPCDGVFSSGRITRLMTANHRAWSSAPKLLRTTPGCRELAVTPVPSRRRASSLLNMTLASLDWL